MFFIPLFTLSIWFLVYVRLEIKAAIPFSGLVFISGEIYLSMLLLFLVMFHIEKIRSDLIGVYLIMLKITIITIIISCSDALCLHAVPVTADVVPSVFRSLYWPCLSQLVRTTQLHVGLPVLVHVTIDETSAVGLLFASWSSFSWLFVIMGSIIHKNTFLLLRWCVLGYWPQTEHFRHRVRVSVLTKVVSVVPGIFTMDWEFTSSLFLLRRLFYLPLTQSPFRVVQNEHVSAS